MSRLPVACVVLAGTVAAVTPPVLAQALPPVAKAAPNSAVVTEVHPPPEYVIGPADVLSVVFWRDKELSADAVVRPDGKITLPLINDVDAAGLTPEQLRVTVVDRARRFMEDPRASVIVKQINSRNVFIVGEVAKPGTYPLTGPTTVLQLIATAGGLGEFASRDQVVVLRTVGTRQMRYKFNYKQVVKGSNLRQNIDLKAGDTVVVP